MSLLSKQMTLAIHPALIQRVFMAITTEAYRLRNLAQYKDFIPQAQALINDAIDADNAFNHRRTFQASRFMCGIEPFLALVNSDYSVDELAKSIIPDDMIIGGVKAMFAQYVSVRT